MRATSKRGVVLLLVLALALGAVAVAGCGGSSKASTSGSPVAAIAASGQSADQIVKDSEAKMATVKSAAFTAGFGLQIQGDTSKMTDPTAKALLSQGVTVTAQGKSGKTDKAGPVVDMTMSLGIAGQTLDFGMKSAGKQAWIGYQGSWYKVDSKNTKSLDKQAANGAVPTQQLKSMGIDPSTWGTSYQLVGTETLNGVQVYHVKATADPQKLADSLTKAAENPNLNKQLGSATGSLGLGSGTHRERQTGRAARQDAQGRDRGLLDRRRRQVHVQGAVRRHDGHVRPEGHAGRVRRDPQGLRGHE